MHRIVGQLYQEKMQQILEAPRRFFLIIFSGYMAQFRTLTATISITMIYLPASHNLTDSMLTRLLYSIKENILSYLQDLRVNFIQKRGVLCSHCAGRLRTFRKGSDLLVVTFPLQIKFLIVLSQNQLCRTVYLYFSYTKTNYKNSEP